MGISTEKCSIKSIFIAKKLGFESKIGQTLKNLLAYLTGITAFHLHRIYCVAVTFRMMQTDVRFHSVVILIDSKLLSFECVLYFESEMCHF